MRFKSLNLVKPLFLFFYLFQTILSILQIIFMHFELNLIFLLAFTILEGILIKLKNSNHNYKE